MWNTGMFSQAARSNRRLGILMDSFELRTWICAPALLVGTTLWLLPNLQRLVLSILAMVVAWSILDALLMLIGLRKDIWSAEVLEGVTTAVNSATENITSGPEGQIVVFLVGARVNHPLGILAPGVKTFFDYFGDMAEDLEQRRTDYGMLGSSSWIANKERSSNNDILFIYYFRTVDGVNRFAHDPAHLKGLKWYKAFMKKHKHLALRHELYHVPGGHWENIFLNSHPTLIGATAYQEEGSGGWRTMLRSSNTKVLHSMWDRMGSDELRSSAL